MIIDATTNKIYSNNDWRIIMLKSYSSMNFDDPKMMRKAKHNLKAKNCLYQNYKKMYENMYRMANKSLKCASGVEVELGSGGGFFKEINKNVITSDLDKTNDVDLVINAMDLPFKNNSVKTIYAAHVLHHIPDIDKFFEEVNRCVHSGGGCVLVEPYWSPLGKFCFKHLHSEAYDDKQKDWKLNSSGPMSGANQALSYIILKRDRKIFNQKYPNLEVIYDRPFNGISYLSTGGIWLKPYLPDKVVVVLNKLEQIFWPFMYLFGVHHMFVIRKK